MSVKILIVDDEVQNRELIEVILHKEAYELFFASNGEEAVEILKKETIDLLLLDLLMPKMDGFSTLKKLQEQNIKQPKVIIITALGDEPNKTLAKAYKVQGYVQKPYDIIDLKQQIKKVLEIDSKIEDEKYEKNLKALCLKYLDESQADIMKDLQLLQKEIPKLKAVKLDTQTVELTSTQARLYQLMLEYKIV